MKICVIVFGGRESEHELIERELRSLFPKLFKLPFADYYLERSFLENSIYERIEEADCTMLLAHKERPEILEILKASYSYFDSIRVIKREASQRLSIKFHPKMSSLAIDDLLAKIHDQKRILVIMKNESGKQNFIQKIVGGNGHLQVVTSREFRPDMLYNKECIYLMTDSVALESFLEYQSVDTYLQSRKISLSMILWPLFKMIWF